MQEICLVIPCYNECKRLPVVEFSDFFNSSPSIHFCFVDDGSKDDTLNILHHLQAGYTDRVDILALAVNQGKAEAVRMGILHVLSWKNFNFVGYFDADLSTPLTEIQLLVQGIVQNPFYQIAFGSRIKRMGTTIERSSKRHYFGRIFSTVASVMLQLPIYDTQCGAKLLKSEVAASIFSRPFITQWLFDLEVFARIIHLFGHDKAQSVMIEVPLNRWIEKGGSKIRIIHLLRVPLDLLKIYQSHTRGCAN